MVAPAIGRLRKQRAGEESTQRAAADASKPTRDDRRLKSINSYFSDLYL
jgi:hypothetical protein